MRKSFLKVNLMSLMSLTVTSSQTKKKTTGRFVSALRPLERSGFRPSLFPVKKTVLLLFFHFHCKVQKKQPCKYYNSGGCRDGHTCPYLHVCRYFLSGNCRYGSRCKLSHAVGERPSSGTSSRAQEDATASSKEMFQPLHPLSVSLRSGLVLRLSKTLFFCHSVTFASDLYILDALDQQTAKQQTFLPKVILIILKDFGDTTL